MGIDVRTFENFVETNEKLFSKYLAKKVDGGIKCKALEMYLGEYKSIEEVAKTINISSEYLIDMILCNKEIDLVAAKGFEGMGYSMAYIADGCFVSVSGYDAYSECAKFDYDVALTLTVKKMCEGNLKLNNNTL